MSYLHQNRNCVYRWYHICGLGDITTSSRNFGCKRILPPTLDDLVYNSIGESGWFDLKDLCDPESWCMPAEQLLDEQEITGDEMGNE
jgi:hypothetical protein